METRFVGWGAGMVDLDNDGHPDLFMVTGSVYPEIEPGIPDLSVQNAARASSAIWATASFEELIDEAGPGIAAAHSSRGCAFGDFDNDGDIDVLDHEPERAALAAAQRRHRRRPLAEGEADRGRNRTAAPSARRVTVLYGGRRQAQPVLSQSSFYSANDFRLHFGLGEAKSAAIEVRWPSGAVERIPAVAAGQLVTIKEGAGVVRAERFSR